MLISFKSNNFNLKPILLILKQTIKISLRIKIQNAFLTSQIKSQMFREVAVSILKKLVFLWGFEPQLSDRKSEVLTAVR